MLILAHVSDRGETKGSINIGVDYSRPHIQIIKKPLLVRKRLSINCCQIHNGLYTNAFNQD